MTTNLKIYLIATSLILFSCSPSKKANSTAKANITKTQFESSRDGSSIEKAIIVRNVSEEYNYVRKVCEECKFKKQSLIAKDNGKKHYDALYFDKAGEEVIYYFDINSFYGKMF